MAAFLENITPFLGTGEKNEAGQSLEDFLKDYDDSRYKKPSNTVDMFILACDGEFKGEGTNYSLLMIKRKNHPNIGFWALPGGFVEMNESLEEAAKRELEEETGLTGIEVGQLYTWGNPDRDPRTRVITTVYGAVLTEGMLKAQAGDDAADALWYRIDVNCVEKKEDEAFCEEFYELNMKNLQQDIALSARIVRKYKKNQIVPCEMFEVVETENIAGDHSAVIVQAYLKLLG